MDGDAVIVILRVSFLAALTLRTAVKSCSTFTQGAIQMLLFLELVEIPPGVLDD